MRTITWDDDRAEVKLIDQTLLPAGYRIIACAHVEELIAAIQQMQVRGAPALGAAGAYGVVLACLHARTAAELEHQLELLRTARPTAINLSYGVARATRAAQRGTTMEEKARLALDEAKRIADEDIAANKQLGAYGSALLEDGDVVLTHCNAGRLACVDWGTALGVIRTAVEQGKRIEVIASETRPLNQGSRLTAWELLEDNIPVTLITDSMSAAMMRSGRVTKVLVGVDRVVKEGIFNKIGTYMHAVVAKAHGVPFYVAAPLSSFDLERSSTAVEIEERPRKELIYCGSKQLAPLKVTVYNPAFDFTPFELISALITETGVFPPQDVPALRTAKR
jgi:methylthioribose-1-phosphate isomerase